MTVLAQRPAHVPERLIYEFDFYKPPAGEVDIHLAWKQLHTDAPPIFWTPCNGGHWIATRAKDIDAIQSDPVRFSNRVFTLPVMKLPVRLPPLGIDPPEHGPIRALISPAFSPRAVKDLTETARTVSIELIEGFLDKGRCEFVGDFAKILPIVVFLDMMGLPREDRQLLLPWADKIVRTGGQEKLEAHKNIGSYLSKWIELRSKEPGTDLISKIALAKVGGQPLDSEDALGLCVLLMLGGLDTVAGMLSFIALYLAEHPELQRKLADNPEIIPSAVEELMRRHGLPNTTRMVAEDIEFSGVTFKKGDVIQLPRALYNLDEQIIDRPLDVDLDRPTPIPNSTFGSGIHKCPGAILARHEIRVFMEEWLRRIPSFGLAPGYVKRTMGGGVNGVEAVELAWAID